MSQRERLRWKIAKWRRITHAVRKWSGTLKTAYTRKWGGMPSEARRDIASRDRWLDGAPSRGGSVTPSEGRASP